MIISAGYRIGPFEVESACVEHPAVKEAAAVASPDPRRGDIVKAFIVLAGDYGASDELADEIKQHVRERHSAYAYPREIEFVDDLPKTLTGKIRRVELREQERERKQADTPARTRRAQRIGTSGMSHRIAAVTKAASASAPSTPASTRCFVVVFSARSAARSAQITAR